MNRRQKKKAFKKRFGFNPPRNISIRTATQIMEYKESIIGIFKRLKAAILNPWEQAVEDFRTKLLLRQQESEAKRIEGNSDIQNRDRR